MDGATGAELYAFFVSKGYSEFAGQQKLPGRVLLTLTDNPLESPVNIPEGQGFLGPRIVRYILEGAGFTVEEFAEWRREDNRLNNR